MFEFNSRKNKVLPVI